MLILEQVLNSIWPEFEPANQGMALCFRNERFWNR